MISLPDYIVHLKESTLNEVFRRLLVVFEIFLIMICASVIFHNVNERGSSEGFFEMFVWGLLVDFVIYGVFATILWILNPVLEKYQVNYHLLIIKIFDYFKK